jgi:hypothetical protein
MNTTQTKMTDTYQANILDTSYNGWSSYETWNVALWIQNDEFLYNTAKACVEYCGDNETPYDKFVRCMCDGMIGRHLVKTPDGVMWNDSKINGLEINEMMEDL